MAAPYRLYEALYEFEAREASELSIAEGDTVVVYEKADGGGWPDPAKWMRGTNQSTGKTGDFPGTYCKFLEEVARAPPPPVAERSRPPMMDGEDAPPVPPRRGKRREEGGKCSWGSEGGRGREGVEKPLARAGNEVPLPRANKHLYIYPLYMCLRDRMGTILKFHTMQYNKGVCTLGNTLSSLKPKEFIHPQTCYSVPPPLYKSCTPACCAAFVFYLVVVVCYSRKGCCFVSLTVCMYD